MYFTGWRKNEVLTRQWRHVDFDAGVIRLEPGETKNGRGRTFPFASLPELKAVLDEQRAYTDATQRRVGRVIPWMFHREGSPIRDFRATWQAACIKARLAVPKRDDQGRVVKDKKDKPVMVATMIPHDFRRTAVRNMERAGVPRSVAMKLVGHQTQAIYDRYAITNESDLREGVGKLAALHGQKPQEEPRGAVAGQIGHG
jgi:integrase